MHQRPALHSREHRCIELFRKLLVIAEDGPAARPAQCLVRRRGDDVSVGKRARMRAAGDQTGKMSHVDHQISADLVGNLAEAAKVDDARIGRATGDDHLGPMPFGQRLDLIHVDEMIIAPDAIGHDFEPAA